MPNVYTACWTMSDQDWGVGANRVDALRAVALTADTGLKVAGRVAGGAFSRMLVVPEYFYDAGAGILDRDAKHATYKQLEDISATVPDLILIAGTIAYAKGAFSSKTYNVCPILHGGRIVKKLYKADDDGVYQVNGAFRTKTDGGKAVPLATIDGLSIGVDICMDYNADRLKTYLNTAHLPAPDVHVQISGTNAAQSSRAQARVGGIYIHCDLGGKGASGATAYKVTASDGLNATTTRINPDRVERPGGIGRLIYFTTPV